MRKLPDKEWLDLEEKIRRIADVARDTVQQEGGLMPIEITTLTEFVKDLAPLRERVKNTMTRLQGAITNLDATVKVVDGVAAQIETETAELQKVMGVSVGNQPPNEEKTEGAKTEEGAQSTTASSTS